MDMIRYLKKKNWPITNREMANGVRIVLSRWLGDATASVAYATGSSDDTALLLLVAAVLLTVVSVLLPAAFKGLCGTHSVRRGRHGDAVLLLGNCGAGKTALFYRLKDEAAFPELVTSIDISDEQLAIQNEEKPTRVVDFPGHGRLRAQLVDYIPEARCIIFVVDSADTGARNLPELSNLMYDVFSECIRKGCEPRVLVACNKADLADALSPENIKKTLEQELDSLKSSRHSLATEGDEGMEIILGTEGEPFEFENDAGCDVEFCNISLREGGEALVPVVNFLEECMWN